MSKTLQACRAVSYICKNKFHTSCSFEHGQQGRFMNKVLGNIKKKKKHYNNESPVTTDAFSSSTKTSVSISPKRVAVLNKLFMRNITDLMSTESCASQLSGLGVEINRVKITPDYKILKVFWTTTDSRFNEAESILLRNAGLLRHELSQLRLMGNVPVIQFVKDKHYGNLADLNNRLAIADYGEDGIDITNSTRHLMSELQLSMSVDSDIKKKLTELDEENPYEITDPEIPPMTNSVFNLDYEDIMNRVKKGRGKTKNVDISDRTIDEKWASFKLKQYSNVERPSEEIARQQRESFNRFLQQRKVLEKKYKNSPRENIETEFILEERHGSNDFETDEVEDFIIEDEEST